MCKKKQFTTNYREAWNKYRKSEEYRFMILSMKNQGIVQPFSNNILNQAFAAGWKATNTKIEAKH